MAKTFRIIADPGLTVALTAERKSNGYFWNPNTNEWQVDEVTVPLTENVDFSANYSEYYTDTNPDAPCYWKALDSDDNWLADNEYPPLFVTDILSDGVALNATNGTLDLVTSITNSIVAVITPLTAATNSVLQSGQQVEVVVGNKGTLFDVVLSGDWTAFDFRFSAKNEPDSSAYTIGPNDVDAGDIQLGADADGNVITTIDVRFTDGDLDIAEGVYIAELTADTGDSSGAQVVTPIQFPLKVIEGLIG